MSLSWHGNGTRVSFSAKASIAVPTPGTLLDNDLLIVVFGFENVGAGSAPYVSGTPQIGWSRLLTQAPSGNGSGLEVWQANWDIGASTTFNFTGTYTGVAREAAYRCDNGVGAVGYGAATQQHTGNNTAFPSVTTIEDGAQVFICGAQTLASPGYGSLAPYVQAFDNTRGLFGQVEIGLWDVTQANAGASGGATATDTASPAGSLGATGAFAAACDVGTVHLLPLLGVGD